MSVLQTRFQAPEDFEDISLTDIKKPAGGFGRNPQAFRNVPISRNSSDSIHNLATHTDDPHSSYSSVSSNVSTPTLTSDTSSLRSSLSSLSSPALATASFNAPIPPSMPAQPGHALKSNNAHNDSAALFSPNPQNSGFRRRQSVPALVDTTSMASLTIRSKKTRKQREMELDEDDGDDIWPAHGLMFNVPMSPALYAQQRHKQHNILPPHHIKTQQHLPQHVNRPMHPQNNNNAYNPSPLQQVHSQSLRSFSARNQSLPMIPEIKGDRLTTTSANGRASSMGSGSAPPDAPELFQRSSSVYTMPNTRHDDAVIDGLDSDASHLTLELSRYEEEQQAIKTKQEGDVSIASLSSQVMTEGDFTLPSPPRKSTASLDEDSSDSRRSSITRPDNLPPKSPEEDRKHLKEYEKLLKEAMHAEKKKQQKREEQARQRQKQAEADQVLWKSWLVKAGKSKLSSDLKWRGVPEPIRGEVWIMQKHSSGTILPPPKNAWTEDIARDSEKVWPECGIFGYGRPLHASLICVVQRFLAARPEISYSFPLTGIAALLLLYMQERESAELMVKLVEANSLPHAVLCGNEKLASANYVSFRTIFQSKFPQLSQHFEKIGLTEAELLNPLMASLFTTVLSTPEAAGRVIDVFVFEGDGFLLRAALGLIRLNEAWLYTSRDEILEEMRTPRFPSDDGLMQAIRDVTR